MAWIAAAFLFGFVIGGCVAENYWRKKENEMSKKSESCSGALRDVLAEAIAGVEMSERTTWARTDPNNPYCLNCGKTWDIHLCDGRTSCPSVISVPGVERAKKGGKPPPRACKCGNYMCAGDC